MSVLSADPVALVPLAVLGASLAGSLHCVAMCGGLAASVSTSSARNAAYQLGRLGGYLGLGTLAGAFGATALGATAQGPMAWLAAALIGAGLIAIGIRAWRGGAPHLFQLPQSWLSGLFRQARGGAFATGLLTAFLPCGWLHGFVLGAAATGNPAAGAAFLGMFWLGTLPALALSPALVQRVLRPLTSRSPRIAGSLLIIAGLLTLTVKVHALMSPATGSGAHEGCHHSMATATATENRGHL